MLTLYIRDCSVDTGDVPQLMEHLKSADSLIRDQSLRSLGCLGSDAKAAAPLVVNALTDDHWVVRRNAIYALGKIDPYSSDAVDPLIQLLGDDHGGVRTNAACALATQGAGAKEAIPALSKLRDRSWIDYFFASYALWKIAEGS